MPREYDKKVRRLIRLYDKLNAGQVLFLPGLAEEFNVSLRSLQRDMAELQALYLPIQSVEREGRCGYALAFDTHRIPVSFGLSDIITVTLALGMMEQYSGTGLSDYLSELARKVKDHLNQSLTERITNLDTKFYAHQPFRRNFCGKEEDFNDLLSALLKQQKLRVRYQSVGGKPRSHLLRPYTLLAYKNGLYLIAKVDHAPEEAAPTVFALERMSGVVLVKEPFEIPASWHPEAFLPKFGGLMQAPEEAVEIDFAIELEAYVRNLQWPPKTRFRKTPEGALRLSATVPINDEWVTWLVGFGAKARVLSPPSLRSRLHAFFAAACAAYTPTP